MKYSGIVTVLPLLLFLYAGCVSSVPVYMYDVLNGKKIHFFVSGKHFVIKRPWPEGLKSSGVLNFLIDPITSKLWLSMTSGRDNKEIYLYEIRNRTAEYKLTLQFDEYIIFMKVIFDNKVVIRYWNQGGRYEIVDLLTNKKENIQIEKINGVYPFDVFKIECGYDGKSLIFENGYYDIAENSYHSFEIKLQYPRYQSVGNLMIGLDDDGFIVYHNIYSNTVEKTRVKRNPSVFYDTGSYSYYIDLEGRYLYYSKDKYGVAIVVLKPFILSWYVVAFLLDLRGGLDVTSWMSANAWYRYNLDKGTTEYVMVPGNRIWWILELLRTEPE